ncbi:MAG: hypothetical protein JNK72_17530 [Myxococcales bacterium]|nr:hypothetical protein [Myxococcales bacterium]
MGTSSAQRLALLSLLVALSGCKIIEKIRNRGGGGDDAGTSTTVTVNAPAAPILNDAGNAAAIPLPNPTVAPNPTEIPSGDAAVAVPDVAVPAMPEVPAVPPADVDAAAPAVPPAPPPTAAPAGGSVPDQITACNTTHTTDAAALAECLRALIPTATARPDHAALAEAMYSCPNDEAKRLLRRDAYSLMDRYVRRYHGDSAYNRFKDRIDRRR